MHPLSPYGLSRPHGPRRPQVGRPSQSMKPPWHITLSLTFASCCAFCGFGQTCRTHGHRKCQRNFSAVRFSALCYCHYLPLAFNSLLNVFLLNF